MAICYACGDNLDQILEALPKISAIPGRLELVSIYRDAKIFVDFAHTPDGLSQAIQSLRKITNGRLITIFGCGGDRDHDKRAIMGNISEKYSDITIVTDDNPRTENPESVRKMIMTGCTNAIEIADRANAIKYGISLLHAEDALLIAGKGHETYQIIGDQTIRFSDREMVLKCVQI